MKPATIAVLALGGAAVGAGTLALLAGPERKASRARKCPALAETGGQFVGVVYEEATTGGADPATKLPMVIAFHGKAAKPGGIRKILENHLDVPARVVAPRGILRVGDGDNWQFWPLFSTTSKTEQFEDDVEAARATLAPFVRQIARCRKTRGRPVLAGHSQGGMMALALAGGSVSRVVASSSWLPESFFGGKMKRTVFVHGTQDDQVPYGRTSKLVADLQRKGRPVSLVSVDWGHSLEGPLMQSWLDEVRRAIS